MKQDVLSWANGRPTEKLISKEALYHPGLIEMVNDKIYFFIWYHYSQLVAGVCSPETL
jgi:hypothetical protein